ncbi:MAG: lipid IV(A) 3-deoxy-D-manno-octulosonic acid transferase [Oxalobacteraceae bacterium]
MPSLTLQVYSALWWLLLPFVLLRLWWRGRREAGYRQHIAERFGFGDRFLSPLIWVHAVSVGETRAAEPLIRALLKQYPSHQILLTHMTPTGRATGAGLFGKEERVLQSHLPYDTLSMTCRFVQAARPSLCVLMETEVWPSLIHSCHQEGVPVALINARLSEKSLRQAQRFASLFIDAAKKITLFAAQTQADAERLRQMGAKAVTVTGSLKFDIAPPEPMMELGAQWRRQFGERPVLLCASTREGEEVLLLDAYMRATLPQETLLVIVPRHPQRFAEVAQLLEQRGLDYLRRSELGQEPLSPQVHILLGDSLGEMFAFYAACDMAFIGGSLLRLGGQNLIEALSCGKPVFVGPHTFNFAQITEDAVQSGVAVRVSDAEALFRQWLEWLIDPRKLQEVSSSAAQFTQAHRGATEKTVRLLSEVMNQLRINSTRGSGKV